MTEPSASSAAGYLSLRLSERLRASGFAPDDVEQLRHSDFSAGQSEHDQAWARHNERVHVGIVVLSPQMGFSRALALATQDWRDLLVASGLANGDWPSRVEAWFADPHPVPAQP